MVRLGRKQLPHALIQMSTERQTHADATGELIDLHRNQENKRGGEGESQTIWCARNSSQQKDRRTSKTRATGGRIITTISDREHNGRA